MEENYALEGVRQQCIAFKKAEESWKANPPKGKVYVGFKFVPFKEDIGMWKSMGWECKPIFRKEGE
jgi:hypothetical protein